jgi:hypothetical protein
MRLLKFAVFAAAVAAVSVSIASFAGASGDPLLPKKALFQAITPYNIGEVRNLINGSADGRNQIPTGTVLVYETNEGNNGKMQILEYGYNLRIKWVTYRPGGKILSRGNDLLVKGTYLYDLDRGVEVKTSDSGADFWWEQADTVHRYLVFENRALFTVVS